MYTQIHNPIKAYNQLINILMLSGIGRKQARAILRDNKCMDSTELDSKGGKRLDLERALQSANYIADKNIQMNPEILRWLREQDYSGGDLLSYIIIFDKDKSVESQLWEAKCYSNREDYREFSLFDSTRFETQTQAV